jgi:hypothetical protein
MSVVGVAENADNPSILGDLTYMTLKGDLPMEV